MLVADLRTSPRSVSTTARPGPSSSEDPIVTTGAPPTRSPPASGAERRTQPWARAPTQKRPCSAVEASALPISNSLDRECPVCRIAPGALLRPGPPRNRTGTFQRIRLEQAVEVRGRGVVRSARKAASVSSAGPFTAACAAASNLSVGAGVVVIFFSLAYLTASARFRAGPQGSVFGRLCGTAAWRGQPSCPGFPLRFRRRHSLLGHPMPAEELGSPHGRLTGPKAGPRRGYRFPHARAAAGVGASYTPRTAVLIPAEGRARPAPAALPRLVLRPRLYAHPSCRAPFYEASVGGLGSSPVRPAPRLWPPDGSGALGLPLELRTPPLPAAHVEGGARSSEHGPGTTRSH